MHMNAAPAYNAKLNLIKRTRTSGKHTGRFARDGYARTIATKSLSIVLNPPEGIALVLQSDIESRR